MLPVALSPGYGQAFLALVFYALPALFVAMMIGGLANVRAEAWDAPEAARAEKARYRRVAVWGLWLNRWLLALFLVQVVALLSLRASDCERHASHLSAASRNLALVVDQLFLVSMLVAFALAVAGAVWAVRYLLRARQEGWSDPRRKDGVVVHVVLVPLSLLLMFVAFGVVPRMLCG